MKTRSATRVLTAAIAAVGLAGSAAAQASKTYKNLELSIVGVERATGVKLGDCPPGANTVSSTARAGEEFAVVTLKVKVLPGYQAAPISRPTLTDAAGKKYNTAVSFVDVGKVPEFSCAIPFRVPTGTKAKSLQVDTVSLDLP
jgi:hypothetical protein